MKRLTVIYHSQSGATRRLVEALVEGAQREAEVQTLLLRAVDADTSHLLASDALVLATPENFGYLSGGMKDFLDRTYYPAQPHALNLPYLLLVSAGNDGTGAVRQMERIAPGYPLRKAMDAHIVRGEPTAEDLTACRELGEAFAAGVAMGIF